MKIIDRIFNTMELKNIKNVDLANKLNISKSVISSWKSRNNNPPAEMIEQIADFLNVSPTFLLTGKEIISDLSKEEIEILKKYNLLTERNKGKVENYIEERIAEQEQSYKTTKEA